MHRRNIDRRRASWIAAHPTPPAIRPKIRWRVRPRCRSRRIEALLVGQSFWTALIGAATGYRRRTGPPTNSSGIRDRLFAPRRAIRGAAIANTDGRIGLLPLADDLSSKSARVCENEKGRARVSALASDCRASKQTTPGVESLAHRQQGPARRRAITSRTNFSAGGAFRPTTDLCSRPCAVRIPRPLDVAGRRSVPHAALRRQSWRVGPVR